jgi:hypothetical protein
MTKLEALRALLTLTPALPAPIYTFPLADPVKTKLERAK